MQGLILWVVLVLMDGVGGFSSVGWLGVFLYLLGLFVFGVIWGEGAAARAGRGG